MSSGHLIPITVLLLALTGSRALPDESQLYHDLLNGYNKMARPIVNASDTIELKVGLSILSYDIDEEKDELSQSLWVAYSWTDPRLVWDPEDYSGIDSVRLMPDQIWMPDVMPYLMLPTVKLDWLEPVPVVVSSDGGLLSVAPTSVRTRCIRRFAWYEDFSCKLKIGSWTYDGSTLDLVEPSLDLGELVSNPAWDLSNHTVTRNENFYPCCEEPYVDITLSTEYRRRKYPESLSRRNGIYSAEKSDSESDERA